MRNSMIFGTRNQLANVHNRFQGEYKRVLFVCSAGLLRSATAAHVFSAEPYNWNTRTAGAAIEYALNPVTEALLEWADEVYCMEPYHFQELKHLFGVTLETIMKYKNEKYMHVLDVPDQYAYRNEKLIEIIKEQVDNAKPVDYLYLEQEHRNEE